ncbi:hypothetical protein FQN54_001460 [Arachnomyces sp. PD_36]|nr:hypothetical protein FQN54_001460 [Arachnomyces sp. PD_36]
MSGLKILQRNHLFAVRYNPLNVPPPIALRYLTKRNNPIYPKIAHMYQTRDPNTLWWSVSSIDMLSEKKVVRSWCCRRVREAFREALERKGFDREGRRVVPDADEGTIIAVKDQKGTLILNPRPEMKKASYEEIQELADKALDLLVNTTFKVPANRAKPWTKKHGP